MRIVHTRTDLASDSGDARRGVVMTMGALHEGHADLIRAARDLDDHVTVTIFVNPMQFGADEDLDRYPRTMDADLDLCERLGVNTVYMPTPDDVYVRPSLVTVDPGELGTELEGAARPTHFRGVLTVVNKLLHLTRPDHAFFGEKDYQQLTLIRSMVIDLDIGVKVVAVPTSREPDGLARSSRNVYLTPEQREQALAIPRALKAGAAEHRPADIEAAAAAQLSGLDTDYVVVRDPELGPPRMGRGRLLVAVRVGATRLIDNCAVEVTGL
ncbi:MAG: pantoate--beta-alanine ligase [Actinobacteria bacterium]|nr:pantoate--beta-alanine ligase [Actinomycetota bacterium]MCB8997627.1 pantoate--beta-alanine ligase [Actinomycetota bacterium]MCB9414550.1 pantoate--beta-alanine ligase [Actinomycetota bacterium]MCB9423860.1 pantoate--beta-alanine ligase [Actinomycetota bacterium]HRY09132.1 pantoate--beta-alanine ligase [Candidatus Nanopelagicales bacterium]